jgi:hypothetical protein
MMGMRCRSVCDIGECFADHYENCYQDTTAGEMLFHRPVSVPVPQVINVPLVLVHGDFSSHHQYRYCTGTGTDTGSVQIDL